MSKKNDRYIIIDNVPYTIGKIKPNLQNKINYLFKNYEKIVEICPNNFKERIELIKNTIGPFAIQKMKNHTRFYKCKSITKEVYKTKNVMIPDINEKCGYIMNKLIDNDIKVFLHGGIIRDYFLGQKCTDIDLVFDTNIYKIKNICNENDWPCKNLIHKNQYINFGEEKGISLEGANLQSSFLVDLHLHEASVNDFAYDVKNNILIDITGYGLQDILYKKIRLSAPPKYFNKWATDDFKKPLRYFKLIEKGFKPLYNDIHQFVINYIVDKYDLVYEKYLYATVSRIKHFLIKNITSGDIDNETGNYTLGPRKDKLVPYLKVLKKHLPDEIFDKIIKIFTMDDIKMLKEKSVVSQIDKYIEKSNKNSLQKKLKTKRMSLKKKLKNSKKKTKKKGKETSSNKKKKLKKIKRNI